MRRRRVALGVVVALVTVAGLCLFNNNVSLAPLSKAEFKAKLDRAEADALDWVLGKAPATSEQVSARRTDIVENIYLLDFVLDTADMTGNTQLRDLLDIRHKLWPTGDRWRRMVEPESPYIAPDDEFLQQLTDYQRWTLHALWPREFPLTPEDQADMFSMDKYQRGHLTHQLLAVTFYRKRQGTSPELERLIRHLGERVAAEARIDFRVTDLYLQRIAFLLNAGMADLVRPRWVERALGAQQPDGGWTYAWYGWDESLWHWRLPEEETMAHSTVQGLWLIAMLKYRFPEWIDQHYR